MWYGHNLPYAKVEAEYIRRTRGHDEKKADEIKGKIANSSTVTSLLRQSISWGHIPNQKQFVNSVQSMFYFLFKSHDAVTLGSLYAMERWNLEVNSVHHLADDEKLVDTIERLTAFCESISNGTAKY
jgi:hypothetical protein